MSFPKTTESWAVEDKGTFDALKLNKHVTIPELSDNEVLVKMHAASLNFRDLIIALGQYPYPPKENVVPGSDGAGEVVSVGSKVTRFQKGSKVVTLFYQTHYSGPMNQQSLMTGLGGHLDGTLRQYAIFNENGLVAMPQGLSYLEASTLPCAALTAWNSLYGAKPLAPGDWVLTQGTGGVSIFALQFAKATGARVIATTSSTAKAKKLEKLGADFVINYKETPNWGEKAKEITGGIGVHHVIEIGGNKTIAQSLNAISIDGVISIIGFIGGSQSAEQPTFLEALNHVCLVRGVLVGNRDQFEAMNRAIEANNIKPVVDNNIFPLESLKEAYQYQWEQKHFGKVVVQIE